MSPEMIVEFCQSARVSVLETTYFGMPFIRPLSSGSPPAVGQNAAQICHVRRPSRSASAPRIWSMLKPSSGPLARRDGFDVIVVAAVCAVIHVAKLG
jgi:hypothetical protein